MIEKLQKRQSIRILFNKQTKYTKKASETRHMHYIENKIKYHWKLKSTPKVQTIQNTTNFSKYVNLRRCDMKLCNKFVFRIPTNKRDAYIKAINITYDIAHVTYVLDALLNAAYKKRDKFIYLLMDDKNQIQPIKKTTIINPNGIEIIDDVIKDNNMAILLDEATRRRMIAVLGLREA